MNGNICFNDPNSNWDIIERDGKLFSVAKKNGCESSFFGDKHHIARLLNEYANESEFTDHITDYGREFMSGLTSVLHTSMDGKRFVILRFLGK